MIGPRNKFSQQLHAAKYRQPGESFDDYCVRYARTTADDERHFRQLLVGLRSQAILPAGRQQRAVGWPFLTTAFNCFVGGTIDDSIEGIYESIKEGALTLRSGGGDGWDFTPIRPFGDLVKRLGGDAYASGPVGFMPSYHTMCSTIRSAGERRGAMMGVLNVHHPDIMRFIRAKEDAVSLTNFNISTACTDEFMEAVLNDKLYELRFGGSSRGSMRALDVWAAIMENNWDWAEPGVLFIDVINRMNPLGYCETICATNPCGEQPLPPDGACLLASLNLVKYLVRRGSSGWELDLDRFRSDAGCIVRACDNVFERTVYPLPAQQREAVLKRRMGVGLTGVADALEVCGHRYGSRTYLEAQDALLELLRDEAYVTSIDMAKTKGSFPLFDAERWLSGGFPQTLPDEIRHGIKKHGLRNGLLLSIAPTGTISLTADNVSSGIEPPPVLESTRTVQTLEGPVQAQLSDWAYEEHGIKPRTAGEVAPLEHVEVLCRAQKFVDSSISKTINFRGGEVTSFVQFKDVYIHAYRGGAKACSAFNMNGKRAGIIVDRQESTCDYAPDGSRACG